MSEMVDLYLFFTGVISLFDSIRFYHSSGDPTSVLNIVFLKKVFATAT